METIFNLTPALLSIGAAVGLIGWSLERAGAGRVDLASVARSAAELEAKIEALRAMGTEAARLEARKLAHSLKTARRTLEAAGQ
jgi:hypothetical protein